MKKIKIIAAAILCLSLAVFMPACSSTKTAEDETGTVHFESPDDAYEAMTGAAEEGNYADAVRYYASGAADADENDVLSWYFYSMAADKFENEGCIGYPLDLIQNKLGDDFHKADGLLGELQLAARSFNGTYENNGIYLYIYDGKIAAGFESQLTGSVICTDELVIRDKEYYWARHNTDGADELLYKLELNSNTVAVTVLGEDKEAEDNTEIDMYAGSYSLVSAEMPEMQY